MDLRKCILTANECYKRGQKINIQGFMLHSTGANNPNLGRYLPNNDGQLSRNYGNHWNQFRPDGRQVCVHGFIGKLANGNVATYQTLPWDYKGWHAGGSANNSYIGVEICEDNLQNGDYFNKVYNEAVELVAYLSKMYGFPINSNTVICHSEGNKKGIASNHSDVMHWFPRHGKSMDTFRADVQAKLNGGQVSTPSPTVVEPTGSYLVQVTTSALNVRTQPGTNNPIATCIRDKGVYTIVAESNGQGANKWGKLKSGAGWISLDFTKKLSGGSAPTTSTKPISVGNRVRVRPGARQYNGGGLASFVYRNTYDVIQVNGDRVVIGQGRAVTAAVRLSDLTRV